MPGKAPRMAYLPPSENLDLLSRLHKFSRTPEMSRCFRADDECSLSESLLNFLLFYALFAWAGLNE